MDDDKRQLSDWSWGDIVQEILELQDKNSPDNAERLASLNAELQERGWRQQDAWQRHGRSEERER